MASRVRSMRWACKPLGLGTKVEKTLIGAIKISIAASTLNAFRARGAYVTSDLALVAPDESAPHSDFMALQNGAQR
ncbi:hypothetical protein [Sphingobium baderi]|uniref:hypothetical protein n=1 Tax=Sphingobium baderi TaxID=1332080 RepID=UPI002B40FCC6|nr:hypothetical protein [Sphingobium baderi]WRD78876.1 hypothetical protein QQ987_19630 [Sphingobium baderi]